MYEGDKLLRLYSATGSLSFSRSSRSSFSMASSIDGSVAFLLLNFLDTAILIMTFARNNAIPTANNGDTEPVIMFTLVSAAAFKKA